MFPYYGNTTCEWIFFRVRVMEGGGIDIRLFGSFNRIATFNNSRKLLRNNQHLYEVLHRSDIA